VGYRDDGRARFFENTGMAKERNDTPPAWFSNLQFGQVMVVLSWPNLEF
jgi:hypothetical protein